MLATRRSSSLSLTGGHIVSDQFKLPSYSPNAVSAQQSFPWEESVDDINTPDIDPSFFDNDPFKKYNQMNSVEPMDKLSFGDHFLNGDPSMSNDESTQQLSHQLEDNFDLSALINSATTPDSETIAVSPNDVLANQYIPATTAPVLHYLEPRPVESIASTINYEDMTTTVDSIPQFVTPSHSSQSYSPALSYLSPSPSPALSYASIDGFTSDTTHDSLIETKPEPEFLQPTVINDHLYNKPTKTTKRRRSSEKGSQREKNNVASKKSRVSKRDKQKQMDDQIQHYLADNARCKKEIETMEKQIQWCKDYLFKKVVASSRS